MPSPSLCPRWALMMAADWRRWAGASVLDLGGGGTVVLPSITALGVVPGSMVYPDAIAAICGRATGLLKSLLTASGGLAGLVVGIDASDRWYAESTTAGWAVTSGGALLGFTGPVASVNVGGGVWRCTAQADWTRGPFSLGAIGLHYTAGGARVTTDEACWAQDVPSATRLAAFTGDGLAWGSANLARRFAFAAGGFEHDAGAHIDAQGRVVLSASQTIPVPTWLDTDFRDWLGFTGAETPVYDASSDWTLTATRPCTGVLCPSRPADRHDPGGRVFGSGSRLGDGSTVTISTGRALTMAVEGWLDGDADAWADLQWHFTRRVVPYMSPGHPGSLYLEHGDCRGAGWFDDGTPYGLGKNPQDDGYRGRYTIGISPDSSAAWQITWPQVLRRRAPLRLDLDLVEPR